MNTLRDSEDDRMISSQQRGWNLHSLAVLSKRKGIAGEGGPRESAYPGCQRGGGTGEPCGGGKVLCLGLGGSYTGVDACKPKICA